MLTNEQLRELWEDLPAYPGRTSIEGYWMNQCKVLIESHIEALAMLEKLKFELSHYDFSLNADWIARKRREILGA